MASFYLNRVWFLLFLSVFGLLLGCNGVGGMHGPATEASGSLTISPEQVTSGDVVTLTFPQKHPENMAIRTPDKKWYTIHAPSEGVFVLPVEQYEKVTSLQLNVEEIKGVVWIGGQKVTKAVFSIPGEYVIYMADNLETEPDNTFFMLKSVNFNP